jgi:hypothetical protein
MKSFLSLIAMFLFGTCLSIGLGSGVANAQDDDDDGSRIAVNYDEVVCATDPSPVVYVITRTPEDGDVRLHSPMLHEDVMVLRLPVQRYLIPRSIGKADAIGYRWTHGWRARSNC